jgi:hypothetical protein
VLLSLLRWCSYTLGAVLAERRTDGRRRVGLTSGNLQLDDACYFLCHNKNLLNH